MTTKSTEDAPQRTTITKSEALAVIIDAQDFMPVHGNYDPALRVVVDLENAISTFLMWMREDTPAIEVKNFIEDITFVRDKIFECLQLATVPADGCGEPSNQP